MIVAPWCSGVEMNAAGKQLAPMDHDESSISYSLHCIEIRSWDLEIGCSNTGEHVGMDRLWTGGSFGRITGRAFVRHH